MFDTFQGLPVHALIVHATVVLVPLMCLLTVLVALRPRLREKYAWWTFTGDVLAVALVYATMQSGERFEERLGTSPAIERHEHLGRQLIWFVIALALTALVVALTTKRGNVLAVGTAIPSPTTLGRGRSAPFSVAFGTLSPYLTRFSARAVR